jgi:hypothetical protein
MQQTLVRDYYDAEILYYFFELLNVLKWKNLKLESCRPHRDLQFSYKNNLHPTSYSRVMIFRKLGLVTPLPKKVKELKNQLSKKNRLWQELKVINWT